MSGQFAVSIAGRPPRITAWTHRSRRKMHVTKALVVGTGKCPFHEWEPSLHSPHPLLRNGKMRFSSTTGFRPQTWAALRCPAKSDYLLVGEMDMGADLFWDVVFVVFLLMLFFRRRKYPSNGNFH